MTRKRSFLTPWINLGASGGPPKDPPGARRATSERLETSRRISSCRRLAVAGVAGHLRASWGAKLRLRRPGGVHPSDKGETPHRPDSAACSQLEMTCPPQGGTLGLFFCLLFSASIFLPFSISFWSAFGLQNGAKTLPDHLKRGDVCR